jgi:hypothetical protein
MFVLATRVIRIYTPQGISFKEKTRHATPILLQYDRNGFGLWSSPENHPADIGKSISGERKIVRLRLIFRLAQKNRAAFSRGKNSPLIHIHVLHPGLAPN